MKTVTLYVVEDRWDETYYGDMISALEAYDEEQGTAAMHEYEFIVPTRPVEFAAWLNDNTMPLSTREMYRK